MNYEELLALRSLYSKFNRYEKWVVDSDVRKMVGKYLKTI